MRRYASALRTELTPSADTYQRYPIHYWINVCAPIYPIYACIRHRCIHHNRCNIGTYIHIFFHQQNMPSDIRKFLPLERLRKSYWLRPFHVYVVYNAKQPPNLLREEVVTSYVTLFVVAVYNRIAFSPRCVTDTSRITPDGVNGRRPSFLPRIVQSFFSCSSRCCRLALISSLTATLTDSAAIAYWNKEVSSFFF